MRFHGKICKDGKFWLAEVPILVGHGVVLPPDRPGLSAKRFGLDDTDDTADAWRHRSKPQMGGA